MIELFCGVVCVGTLPFRHYRWCRGFCRRTESDLFLFLLHSEVLLKFGSILVKVYKGLSDEKSYVLPLYLKENEKDFF